MIFHFLFLIIKRRVNAMPVEGNEDVPFEFFFVLKKREREKGRISRIIDFFSFLSLSPTGCTTDHFVVIDLDVFFRNKRKKRKMIAYTFLQYRLHHFQLHTSFSLALSLCSLNSTSATTMFILEFSPSKERREEEEEEEREEDSIISSTFTFQH